MECYIDIRHQLLSTFHLCRLVSLFQILAGFQKENNTGNNMRQIPQDSALTQERALKALIIDRDNKVRQQIEATYAQQVGILLCFKSIVILVSPRFSF